MKKILYKTVTSLFLGAAVLLSAPSAFADNGERGWKKYDRHFNNQHNKRHNNRHNKHRQNRWVRNNHDHSTCDIRSHHHNTRHNNTRYNNTFYNNTRHHNTRHNQIRHNIRHNNTRFNDVFNSLVIDFASSSNAYPTNNHYATSNNHRNIWDRQKNQKRRIRNGVKSGQLTHHETKKLRRGLRKIRDKISYFKSDGHFVRQERRTVHNMLDRSSDHIYRKKHNRVTRSNQHSNQYSDHRTANNNNNGRYNYYH